MLCSPTATFQMTLPNSRFFPNRPSVPVSIHCFLSLLLSNTHYFCYGSLNSSKGSQNVLTLLWGYRMNCDDFRVLTQLAPPPLLPTPRLAQFGLSPFFSWPVSRLLFLVSCFQSWHVSIHLPPCHQSLSLAMIKIYLIKRGDHRTRSPTLVIRELMNLLETSKCSRIHMRKYYFI